MTEAPAPKSNYFDRYAQWLRAQGKSENTVITYLKRLKLIGSNVEAYFADPIVKDKKYKVAAYRSYLKFLKQKMNELSNDDYFNLIDMIKAPQERGNKSTLDKFSVPRSRWEEHIKKAPNQVAKMAMWIGFNFGLRAGEIVHLRIQDIDFKNKEIIIRPREQEPYQEWWKPKYNRTRQVPFNLKQAKVLRRWIEKVRPKEIREPYLLWTTFGVRKYERVQKPTLRKWVQPTGLNPRILRYTYATFLYNISKDIALVSMMLGHENVAYTMTYLQLDKKESMDRVRSLFDQV